MDAAKVLFALMLTGVVWEPSEVMAAGQAGWSGATSQQSASNYDRYGQPLQSNAASITQRAQNAFTDTGTALRDGVEAGIRAAEQKIGTVSNQTLSSNPFFATTPTTGTTTGTTPGGVTSPWPTTPSGTSTAPAWSSNTAPSNTSANLGTPSVTATQGGGWTSIGTEIPAPKLLIPQSPMVTTSSNSTSNYVNQTTPTNPNGPNFPALAENEQPRLHSVLSDPEHSTTPANKSADDWINAWNNRSTTQPATIGRDADPSSLGSTVGQSQLVPLRSNVESPARDPRESTAARLNENWSNTNSFNQPQQNPPPASISKNRNNVAPVAAVANSPFNDQPVGPIAAQPNNQSPNAPLSQNSQIVGNLNAGNMNQNANSAGMTPLANNGMNQIGRSQYGNNGANEQQPWLPLVASVLTLAASLAANLYLGASYLDARQKYQSLVRKTAETFRRVKAVAA